jgi:hypothetical protein
MKVKLIDARVINCETEMARGSQVQPIIIFICSLINQVIDEQRVEAVVLDYPELIQEL